MIHGRFPPLQPGGVTRGYQRFAGARPGAGRHGRGRRPESSTCGQARAVRLRVESESESRAAAIMLNSESAGVARATTIVPGPPNLKSDSLRGRGRRRPAPLAAAGSASQCPCPSHGCGRDRDPALSLRCGSGLGSSPRLTRRISVAAHCDHGSDWEGNPMSQVVTGPSRWTGTPRLGPRRRGPAVDLRTCSRDRQSQRQ